MKLFNNNNLKHLAVIMDGNARWAQKNNVPSGIGHSKGAEAAKALLHNALDIGIPYLTLFAFSSENWQRSEEEISFIFQLLAEYLEKDLTLLSKENIRIKVVGRLNMIDDALRSKIENVVDLTKNNTKMTLCIAFSYGGRSEIVDACQKIINDKKANVTEETFREYLYDPEMPDIDLLIRTSGDHRISNFLLWHIAYAELFFSNKYWPEFTKDDLIEAIQDYTQRNRRFGRRDYEAVKS